MESDTHLKSPEPKNKPAPVGTRAGNIGNVGAENSEGPLSPEIYGAPESSASRETDRRREWLKAISDDPRITPCAYRLAVILSSHMKHHGGVAKPTLRLLARCTRRTRRSAYSHLKLLRDHGYLARQGDGIWIGKPHTYQMQFPNGEVCDG